MERAPVLAGAFAFTNLWKEVRPEAVETVLLTCKLMRCACVVRWPQYYNTILQYNTILRYI